MLIKQYNSYLYAICVIFLSFGIPNSCSGMEFFKVNDIISTGASSITKVAEVASSHIVKDKSPKNREELTDPTRFHRKHKSIYMYCLTRESLLNSWDQRSDNFINERALPLKLVLKGGKKLIHFASFVPRLISSVGYWYLRNYGDNIYMRDTLTYASWIAAFLCEINSGIKIASYLISFKQDVLWKDRLIRTYIPKHEIIDEETRSIVLNYLGEIITEENIEFVEQIRQDYDPETQPLLDNQQREDNQ